MFNISIGIPFAYTLYTVYHEYRKLKSTIMTNPFLKKETILELSLVFCIKLSVSLRINLAILFIPLDIRHKDKSLILLLS